MKRLCVERKKLTGQYFTVNKLLQEAVFNMVKYKGEPLLEPSFGAGHLLKPFKGLSDSYPMTCYELDHEIDLVVTFNEHQKVIYGDFTAQKITERFKTIIGNPPYVARHGAKNLYIVFIEICYGLLKKDGELVFIVPSDFFKMTSASAIIETMAMNGAFTDVYFPHDERLFDGASIDVVVFRYEKGCTAKRSVVNGKDMFCNVHRGIITFSESELIGAPLSEHFDIYVGPLTGRDEVYRNAIGNIDVLSDKDRTERFIFTETFPTANAAVNEHLLKNKEELLSRKIKKFTEDNWFEWGAPRNIKSIQSNMGKPCIYVRSLTRSNEVAFVGTVQFFSGSLLCMIPNTGVNLTEVVAFLNSHDFQKDYRHAGRFKIGQKMLECVRGVPAVL